MRTDRHRVEFGGVQPGQGKPSGTEEGDEQEETECASLGGVDVLGDETAESDKHGDCLTNGADQEQLAATDLFNEQERGQGESGIDDRQDTTENERQTTLEPDVLLEELGGVVNDGITSSELLEQLGRGTDGNTAEVLVATTLEQVTVASLDVGLSSESVRHLVLFGYGELAVDRGGFESGDDLERLGVTAVLHEPSRRLRKDEYTGNEDEGEKDLERNGESPGDRAVMSISLDYGSFLDATP